MTPDLPDAPEWTAKTVLADLVGNSPLLRGKVHFFCYSEDDGPMTDADPDMLPRPFIRMQIRPAPSAWFAAGIHKFVFDAAFEIGVDGVVDRPLLALWHAVRTALSDQQVAPGGARTVRQVKQEAGITVTEFQLAGYAMANLGKGVARYLYGLGYMHCELLRST